MANAVIALTCRGYALDSPEVKAGLAALEALCIEEPETFRVQPCLSPIWDTALTVSTLVEAGLAPDHPALVSAGLWLLDRQTRCSGDWRLKASAVQPGGWAFQFENEYYPDVDDSSVVLMSLRKIRLPDEEAKTRAIARGLNWVLALQGSDGGWGAYDKDNQRLVFNKIPFADHGALMDPSTEDLAGRVLEALGYLGFRPDEPAAALTPRGATTWRDYVHSRIFCSCTRQASMTSASGRSCSARSRTWCPQPRSSRCIPSGLRRWRTIWNGTGSGPESSTWRPECFGKRAFGRNAVVLPEASHLRWPGSGVARSAGSVRPGGLGCPG